MNTQTTTTDYRTPTPNTVEFKVDIRFHTDDVDILFAGRDTTRHPRFIPRYTVVARALNNIHMELLADNPFAENVLIELDIRLAQLVGIGQRRIERCQEIAAQAEEEEGLSVQPMVRQQPYVYGPIATYNKYGRYLIRVYGRTDLAIRWLRTINAVSLLESRLTEQWIRQLLSKHRGVNEVILWYSKRLRHVTREDVRNGSDKARELAESLGRQVATEVLNKTRRCKFYSISCFADAWHQGTPIVPEEDESETPEFSDEELERPVDVTQVYG